MRLVLCDDHRILGEALAVGLRAHGHVVVAITTTVADGIAAVAADPPDICLLDLHFPGPEDGLDAARHIRREHPETKILVLSGFDDRNAVVAAIDAGVAGFIRKDQKIERIADALEVIAAGGTVFESQRRSPVGQRAWPRLIRSYYKLTEREEEVLRRLVAGQSTVVMVREMGITTGTLRAYVRNVLIKLGTHSRLQAVALACREDLLAGVTPVAEHAHRGRGHAAPTQSVVVEATTS